MLGEEFSYQDQAATHSVKHDVEATAHAFWYEELMKFIGRSVKNGQRDGE